MITCNTENVVSIYHPHYQKKIKQKKTTLKSILGGMNKVCREKKEEREKEGECKAAVRKRERGKEKEKERRKKGRE